MDDLLKSKEIKFKEILLKIYNKGQNSIDINVREIINEITAEIKDLVEDVKSKP